MYSGDEYYSDEITSPTEEMYYEDLTHLKCYMCVAPEHRMEETPEHPWPLCKIVRTAIAGRADPTEIYILECGHTII